MKHFNFWALALTAIIVASCTSEDDLTLSPPANQAEEETMAPILFTSSQSAFTRADFTGAEAAKLLGKKFVVTGFKGSTTASPGSIVFDNYLVEYAENTANTTESNSSNWEYVGKGLIPHAVTNGITQQTIKYWDYTQTQYDFIAWSTGSKDAVYDAGDLADGKVLVTNIQPNSKDKSWRAAGTGTYPDPAGMAYTLTGKAADLKECYVADMVTVYKDAQTGTDPVYNVVYKGYQQPVTLKFRQLGTKVRIGLYETVPGYSVKNVKFYTKGGALTKTGDVLDANQIVDNATIFSAGADIYQEGTYKIFFPKVDDPTDADNNQAHITFAPKDESASSKTTIVDWGTLKYTYRESGEKDNGAVYLGRASNNATYAGNPDNNYYEIYLPNETNGNLNIRVDFTLESIDGSGEIIEVKNAKAQVPSIYTTWKPGFAYTYLFKISDNTNGRTGVYDPTQADDATINSDPAGLYPITFDAVVVNAEDNDGTQETITTVATPSITTYQQKSTVVNANEYTVNGKDIFVTVNTNWNKLTSGESLGDLVTMNTDAAAANGVALYVLEDGMTEAEVVDALTYPDTDDSPTGKIKGRSGKLLTIATNVATNATLSADNWKLTNTVEFGANGNPITVANNQAMRFMPKASTTYAFVYTEKAATSDVTKNKVLYEAIAADKVATFTGNKYRYDYKATVKSHSITTDDKGTAIPDDDDITDYFDAQKGHVYFKKSGDAEPYTYTRIVKPFIGQGATNLFTLSGSTYTKATTDYAQSGIKYYYTTDGQHYTEAHLVTYAENMLSGLYEEDTTNPSDPFKATTDTAPEDGKAYYYKDGTKYIYCVFLPQQVDGKWELNKEADKVLVVPGETIVDGQTYFDQYTVNDAVRYAKVIKVAATPAP